MSCMSCIQDIVLHVMSCMSCMQDIVMREAMVMRQQRHPNVLPLLAAFLSEAVLWMVMPYVAGGSAIHILNKRFRGVSCQLGAVCVHQSALCRAVLCASQPSLGLLVCTNQSSVLGACLACLLCALFWCVVVAGYVLHIGMNMQQAMRLLPTSAAAALVPFLKLQ